MNSKFNASVVEKEDVADGLFFLRVKPDEEIPDFLPGQYVALGLENEEKDTKIDKRAYSIGSAPSEKGHLEFYIATVPEGLLTPRLSKLASGDRLFCAKKITGTFTLDPVPVDGNLVLVSTGTGLAPFMSMLRTPATWEGQRKIALVHGVRYEHDLAYAEELKEFEQQFPERFQYLSTVSRASDNWSGDKGYVHQFFQDGRLPVDSATDHIFLCGNPAMIDELSAWLSARGFSEHTRKSPGNLHLENYW